MDAITDRLFVGDHADAQDIDQLRDHRIDTVINLSRLDDPEITGVTVHDHPLTDGPGTTQETFDRAVDAVLGALEEGGTVLVHCQMGVSRSVAVAATALAVLEDLSLREALNRLEIEHPEANPHPALVEQADTYLDSGVD